MQGSSVGRMARAAAGVVEAQEGAQRGARKAHRSSTNSAMLVCGGGGLPIEANHAPIESALPKYATRPIESTMQLSKPAKLEAGGWWIVHMMMMERASATRP